MRYLFGRFLGWENLQCCAQPDTVGGANVSTHRTVAWAGVVIFGVLGAATLAGSLSALTLGRNEPAHDEPVRGDTLGCILGCESSHRGLR